MCDFSIETKSLNKTFHPNKKIRHLFSFQAKGQYIKAIVDLNLQIKYGELFVLIGPNGAGKTTLIKILSGLILPSTGLATINGYDVVNNEVEVKRSVGLITSDERSFYWRLTGRQNLVFFATLYNLSRSKRESRIEELSKILHIDDLDRRFQEYSSGIKQRFAIARSLLHDPPILLMDEPAKNLDPIAAQELRKLIRNVFVLAQRKTVLFCTHNLTEASLMADRIAIMDKGMIKVCGNLREIKEKASSGAGESLGDLFNYYVSK